MKKCTFIFVIIFYFFQPVKVYGQGEAAVPFLLITTHAEASAMGTASVALVTNDPLAIILNPAHLGMQSLNNYFSGGFNNSDWIPIFLSDIKYQTQSLTAGINFGKLYNDYPKYSLGFGYSKVHLDLGTFIRTGSDSPEPIGTFSANEYSTQYSIGFGIEYYIKASIGATFKKIRSNLASEAVMNARDYGLLFDVPVLEIISGYTNNKYELYPEIFPFFNLMFGYSKSNIGDRVVYAGLIQADPLPRTARIGTGVNMGIEIQKENFSWKPISLRWTLEESDLLVTRSQSGSWKYQPGIGDIKLFSNIFFGASNPKTERGIGWELNIFEFLAIRGGRFEDPLGSRYFNTSGYGLNLKGIFKFISYYRPDLKQDSIFGFIINHIDLQYNRSSWNPDEDEHPLTWTEFKGFNLIIAN